MDIPINDVDNNLSKGTDNENRWQPDLVIQDKDNNIIAIVEIKFQIGYWNYNNDITK